MRKFLTIIAILAFSSAFAFAGGANVVIQNEEDSTLYYVVDPPDLAGLSAGSPMASTKLAEYFAAQSSEPSFTGLAPGAQATLTGLSDGTHLMVVFFALKDQDTFPVRVVSLQADSLIGERFYAIFATPSLVEAPRGVGRLAQFGGPQAVAEAPAPAEAAPAQQEAQPAGQAETPPAATAESPAPAEAAPAEAATAPAAEQAPAALPAAQTIAAFSPSYNPVVFTRESQAGLSVEPIGSSRSWNSEGTRIMAINGRIDGPKLTLTLNVAQGFSPDVSYYFYVFGSRRAGTADDFTLELRPRARPDRGACILWRTGAAPRMFGSVTVTGSTATLEASLSDVPLDLLANLGPATTFDLTSCSYDKAAGTYEEFYFATVAMADIPVITR